MTDRRVTPESQKAREIIEKVQELQHPFSTSFTMTGLKPRPIYDRVRHAFTKTKTAVSLRGNTLFIGTRKSADKNKLKDMIRRLAMHVDNESLYEEALELVRYI